MSFVGQFRMDEVPSSGITTPMLLSFHYCLECAYEGNMPFGQYDLTFYDDPTLHRGFALDFFPDPMSREADGMGIVAEAFSPSEIEFDDADDYPGYDDVVVIPELAVLHPVKDGMLYEERQSIWSDPDWTRQAVQHPCHEGPKVGGWPYWYQYSNWPASEMGKPLTFIGQLDDICPKVTWSGGYAYLFFATQADGTLTGTIELQN